LWDAHDIACDGESFVVVSTLSNTIYWISASGEIIKKWNAPGEGDAWHLMAYRKSFATLSSWRQLLEYQEFASHGWS
jgi:hypothetical protein